MTKGRLLSLIVMVAAFAIACGVVNINPIRTY